MKNTASTWLKTGAVGLAGLVVGGVLAATLSANADTATGTSVPARGFTPPMAGMGHGDPSQPQRDDEELLHGDTLTKVKEAALAKYPGATVVRVETDSDGVYEAHLTTSDGAPVTVEVDKSFKVTGEEQTGPGGPGGFHGQDQQSRTDDGGQSGSGDTA